MMTKLIHLVVHIILVHGRDDEFPRIFLSRDFVPPKVLFFTLDFRIFSDIYYWAFTFLFINVISISKYIYFSQFIIFLCILLSLIAITLEFYVSFITVLVFFIKINLFNKLYTLTYKIWFHLRNL